MAVRGALTTSRERRKVKGKGEKERHSHMSVEFETIARGDKKVFLSEQ